MARQANRFFICIFILGFCHSVCCPSEIKSPFNGLALDLNEKPSEYSILLSGHLYGGYSNSVFPAASLLANIDSINARDAKIFISLGDNFRKCNILQISNYKKAFAVRLKIPLFNAVGNTDISNRKLYERYFGHQTYYAFIYNHDYYIFLDSELDNGSILSDQLSFFLSILRNAQGNPDIRNVLIFSHRWIWVVKNNYKAAFEISGFPYEENNFQTQIEPAIVNLAKTKPVYWFSGENGPAGSLPLFYAQDSKHNITYIGVGLGDTEKDALIECSFDQRGSVQFTPISLTGKDVNALEMFGMEYWKKYYRSNNTFFEKYSGKVLRMLQSLYFWTGVLAMAPLTGLIIYFMRRH